MSIKRKEATKRIGKEWRTGWTEAREEVEKKIDSLERRRTRYWVRDIVPKKLRHCRKVGTNGREVAKRRRKRNEEAEKSHGFEQTERLKVTKI